MPCCPPAPAGKVLVNDRPVLKAGTPVSEAASVVITAAQPKYVCRAGLKLEAALAHWGLDVAGKAALDSGLSTGGFTDCLLQHGAASVIGVDVGYGQVGGRLALSSGWLVGWLGRSCSQCCTMPLPAAQVGCSAGVHAWPGLPAPPACIMPHPYLPSHPAPSQVAERVRVDPRVRVLERTNLRSLRLADLGCPPLDIVTLDLSFISVIKMLDTVGGAVGRLDGRAGGGRVHGLVRRRWRAAGCADLTSPLNDAPARLPA